MGHLQINILIPVYNAAKYLRRCLDSILHQTFFSFEVICIDDGSTDSSFIILQEYEKKDKRVKVFSNQKNIGVADTRNLLLEKANAKYIAFIDADDYVASNYIDVLYTNAEKHNADLVCLSNEKYVSEDIVERIKLGIRNTSPCFRLCLLDLIRKNKICMPSTFYSEDLTFAVLTFVFAKKIVFLNENLYFYCKENKNSNSSQSEKMFIGRLANALYIDSILKEKMEYSSDVKKQLSKMILWYFAGLRKVKSEIYKQQVAELKIRVLERLKIRFFISYYFYKLLRPSIK